MSNVNNISFRFGGREIDEQGRGSRISIRCLKSDFTALQGADYATLRGKYGSGINEMLRLAHSLRKTKLNDAYEHVGFDYTYDYPLAAGDGYPYVFPYKLA